MSELITDKLTGKTAAGNVTITSEFGAATMQLQQGLCKSWCDWNNTGTPAIDDSFNVSGLTDTGTGLTGINLTSYMKTPDYAASGFGSNGYSMMGDVSNANTTSRFNVMVWYGGVNFDSTIPKALVMGDLA